MVALGFAVFNLLGLVPDKQLTPLILAVLALLAVNSIGNRYRTEEVLHLLANVKFPEGAGSFFIQEIPDMRQRLNEAKSICISGITLSRTSDSFWGLFKQKVEEGGTVRILIVDPSHPALEVVAFRFYKHQDPERLRRESQHSLDNFETLFVELENAPGTFEVRLLPMAPPYGIWMLDANTPKAEIWVELYSFQSELEPTFHLLPQRDGKWFSFFQEQFEAMWAASTLSCMD